MNTAALATELVNWIGRYRAVAVAFSGGVDSAVVARAAVTALGERAIAVTAVSPSLAASDREIAATVAQQIGIRHLELATHEFQRDEYRRNAGDRCFFCKDTLYSLAVDRMKELDVDVLLNGANADDLGDYRPGMKAAEKYSVRSPLIELNLHKAQVRELARYWNLSVSEKPASPCLASRIAYGVEVTEERVRRVEQSESLIRKLTGITELRVRHEANDLARIEVPAPLIAQLMDDHIRRQITTELRGYGFRAVTIDLEGFRSGNLNDSLPVVMVELLKG